MSGNAEGDDRGLCRAFPPLHRHGASRTHLERLPMPRATQQVLKDNGGGFAIEAPPPSMSSVTQPSFEPPFYSTPVLRTAYLVFVEAPIVATIVGALSCPRRPGSRHSRRLALGVTVATLAGMIGGALAYAAFTAPQLLVDLYSWRLPVGFLVLGSAVGLSLSLLASPALAGPKMRLRTRRTRTRLACPRSRVRQAVGGEPGERTGLPTLRPTSERCADVATARYAARRCLQD